MIERLESHCQNKLFVFPTTAVNNSGILCLDAAGPAYCSALCRSRSFCLPGLVPQQSRRAAFLAGPFSTWEPLVSPHRRQLAVLVLPGSAGSKFTQATNSRGLVVLYMNLHVTDF